MASIINHLYFHSCCLIVSFPGAQLTWETDVLLICPLGWSPK